MYKFFLKRAFDFTIALIALIILTPILLPICIILLFTGEHYVFYLQKRVGYKNKNFKICKFATMIKNSSKMGSGSLTIRNDPRVLPIGKFLRKTKINELPQIINVLIGNMSFVGARPQMEIDFLKFSKSIQDVIYSLKPGITGIGSIVFRDEEMYFSKTEMDIHEFDKKFIAPYKGELEKWYQSHCSFITDIKIIILTILIVFNSKNDIVFKFFKDLPAKPDFM